MPDLLRLPPRIWRDVHRVFDEERAFMLRKELRQLDRELKPDENVLAMASASDVYIGIGLVVVTSERVLYLRKRFLRSVSVRAAELREVEDIVADTSVAGGKLWRVTLHLQIGGPFRFSLTPTTPNREEFVERIRRLATGARERASAARQSHRL